VNVSFLLPIWGHAGPFATAYLDITRSTEEGVRLTELTWRGMRDSLADQGARVETLEAMAGAVTAGLDGGAPLGAQTQVIVAAAGEVLYDDRVSARPPTGRVSWGGLPDLFPLIALQPPRVPHIVALVDRAGADLAVYGPTQVETDEVTGRRYPITRAAAGGWSQRRYQQRAENLWAANAHLIAEHMDRLAQQHRTRLIVLAGDGRAKAALLDALPGASRDQVVEVRGGRDPSVDDDTLRDSTQRLVADEATTQEQAVMDRFVEERGHDGRAVEGLADTTSALRQGRVDHLLIAADGIENPIPIGPDPLDLATAPEVLEQVGVVATVRADAALVRAAAGNSADVHAVDQAGGLEGKAIGQAQDGVGALLRF